VSTSSQGNRISRTPSRTNGRKSLFSSFCDAPSGTTGQCEKLAPFIRSLPGAERESERETENTLALRYPRAPDPPAILHRQHTFQAVSSPICLAARDAVSLMATRVWDWISVSRHSSCLSSLIIHMQGATQHTPASRLPVEPDATGLPRPDRGSIAQAAGLLICCDRTASCVGGLPHTREYIHDGWPPRAPARLITPSEHRTEAAHGPQARRDARTLLAVPPLPDTGGESIAQERLWPCGVCLLRVSCPSRHVPGMDNGGPQRTRQTQAVCKRDAGPLPLPAPGNQMRPRARRAPVRCSPGAYTPCPHLLEAGYRWPCRDLRPEPGRRPDAQPHLNGCPNLRNQSLMSDPGWLHVERRRSA
jgi:hypothetical protein